MSSVPATRLKVALFGTPAFALPTLEMLAANHNLLLIVTQPDRKAGRGHPQVSPPVAQRARELGIELWQPERLRRDALLQERMRELQLDVAVTAAYGQILSQMVLEIPRHGFLNVHGSLLPRWRGAAPVQHAIIAGDGVTGISIMQTDVGLDTGAVRLTRHVAIDHTDTAVTLMNTLAQAGADALREALALLTVDALPSTPQDAALVTHAPRLTRDDGRIRWHESAAAIHNRHRGVQPWPGSWCLEHPMAHDPATRTVADAALLKVHQLQPVDAAAGLPGCILALEPAGMTVACGVGAVRLQRLQRAGKPQMDAFAFAQGARWKVGDFLG